MLKQPVARVESERLRFRTLLLSNPNYFGTLKGSKLPVVKAIGQNTNYEKLVCVGFHPQLDQLEAVVHINQSSGYGGTLCSGGSEEYVRFFLSYDDGATWLDQGLAQFAAYNFPHERHLEYAVSLPCTPKRKFCSTENIVRIRAILSWSIPPSANNPNFIPVWGNVLDTHVQVAPRRFFLLPDLFDELKVEIPKNLPQLEQFEHPIPIPDPEPWPIETLQAHYQKSKVPQHRYLLKYISEAAEGHVAQDHVEAHSPVAAPIGTDTVGKIIKGTNALSTKSVISGIKAGAIGSAVDFKIDWESIIKFLGVGDGNTTYESLTCVGYDPTRDALAGVVRVKLSSGYSGPLCSAGSTEYVAFWVNWNDGAGWIYSGTSAVRVHDIHKMPKDGLDYAVFNPINTTHHRKRCVDGPVTAQVRAILSWNVAPPTNDPDFTPVWGNREETVISLTPGAILNYRPIIESVGYTAACSIDQATGKTYAPASQPFGAAILVTGLIPNAPDLSTPSGSKLRYRIQVRELPTSGPIGAWQTLANSFGITVTQQIGSALPTQFGLTQTADADGYYTYEEDMDPGGAGWRLVMNRTLGVWYTAAPMHGLYEIKVDAKDPDTNVHYPAQTLLCSDGTSRTTVKVYLDEIAPDVHVAITGYTRGGSPIHPATRCGTFQVGDVIHGTYSVTDEHFSTLSLTVEPAADAHGAAPVPGSRSYPIVPTVGESGNWTLDTGPMDPCGYVVRLDGWDRTINGGGGWHNYDTVGFCLKKPNAP